VLASVFVVFFVAQQQREKNYGYFEKLEISFEFKEQRKIKAQHINHM
jgi:hypothetical protein